MDTHDNGRRAGDTADLRDNRKLFRRILVVDVDTKVCEICNSAGN